MSTDNMQPTSAHRIARRAVFSIFLVVGVIGLIGGITLSSLISNQSSLRQGMSYLVSLEQIDVPAVTAKIEERNKQELQAKMNAILDEMSTQEESIWPLFKDSIILGDSRAKGLYEYGFLPEQIVWAEIGTGISSISKFTDRVGQVLPKTIYISFGINDVEHGLGTYEENGYAHLLEQYIQELLVASPQSKIVVNSIIPTATWLTNAQPVWQNIPDYNRHLQEMCAQNGWVYVDNNEISGNGEAPIYEGDGIHFYYSFYEPWALNMLRAQVNAS